MNEQEGQTGQTEQTERADPELTLGTLDLVAISIDQPRGWKGVIVKGVTYGVIAKLTSMTIDGIVNKYRQIRGVKTSSGPSHLNKVG